MFKFAIKTHTRLGVAFNETTLRFVELQHRKNGFYLINWGETPLQNKIMNNAIIAMPHHTTMIKQLQIPAELNDEEIINYIETNAVNYFNHEATQLYIDFIKTNTQLRVIAARQEEVKKYLIFLDQYNIKPSIVDTELLVLERVYNHCFPWIKQQLVAGIYGNATNLLFCILLQGQAIYVRTENYDLSTHALNTALTRFLQLFISANPSQHIKAILLAGDVPTAINLELPVHQCNLLSSINWEIHPTFETYANSLTLAIGLAMWGSDNEH